MPTCLFQMCMFLCNLASVHVYATHACINLHLIDSPGHKHVHANTFTHALHSCMCAAVYAPKTCAHSHTHARNTHTHAHTTLTPTQTQTHTHTRSLFFSLSRSHNLQLVCVLPPALFLLPPSNGQPLPKAKCPNGDDDGVPSFLIDRVRFLCVCICRDGQNHIYIRRVYVVFLAEKSPNIRSYTVYIYGTGQPCVYVFCV